MRRAAAGAGRVAALTAIVLVAFPRLPPHSSLLAARAQQPPALTRPQALVRDGLALLDANKSGEAQAPFVEARDLAHAAGDAATEAEARRGLSIVLSAKKDLAGARAELDEALRLFTSIHDLRGLGRTYNSLGILAWTQGNWKEVRDFYQAAADSFDRAGDQAERARSLRNLTFDQTLDDATRVEILRRAWEIVHPLDIPRNEGLILHQWGDVLTAQGEYAAALEKLEAASPLLQRAGAPLEVANLATSLGRAYRLHGLPEEALPYYKGALAIAQRASDPRATAQALSALSIVSTELGHKDEALEYLQRALEAVRSSGNRPLVLAQTIRLAEGLIDVDRHAAAIAALEAIVDEVGKLAPSDAVYYHGDLAKSYAAVGRLDDAVREADRAVALAEDNARPADLSWSLGQRARVRLRGHDAAGARADAERAVALIERMRATLPPRDYLKQGFSDASHDAFTLAIDVNLTLHDAAGALALAEQARGRAFQDLLATRESAAGAPAAAAPRGEGLASSASAAAPTITETKAIVARLHAPLLAYWVAPHETFIWAVTPGGAVTARRTRVEATRLDALARASSAAMKPGAAAGTELRELYNLLIRPVRDALQGAPQMRLAIIPHGPLFRVSFAALTDERGRYLVEQYAVHYAPAIGVLRFTGKNVRPHAPVPTALLVADPEVPPTIGKDALRPLPAARLEIADAARLLGGRPDLLTGRDATETRVRALAGGRDVLHFATHGVVTDRNPLESYLAFARVGTDAPADGRLTTLEVYGLHLSADLVVLSACRSGAGKITGDGIIGLTRGFFYAGTPSVIATLWDLDDEPARYVMRRFYTHWRAGVSKAAALRAAQQDTIRALRAGQIVADTPFGRVTLAERPSLWAAFVLLGEP